MTNPLFWLVLSLLFVTISLTIVLVVAIPALLELARAARSAEKLFDTLHREFPPTLEAIRLTGIEISDLSDEVSENVRAAGNVVKQVDQSLSTVRKQARKAHINTRSVMAGLKTAWRTFANAPSPNAPRPSIDRLPPGRAEMPIESSDASPQREPVRLPTNESKRKSPPLPSADSTHALLRERLAARRIVGDGGPTDDIQDLNERSERRLQDRSDVEEGPGAQDDGDLDWEDGSSSVRPRWDMDRP